MNEAGNLSRRGLLRTSLTGAALLGGCTSASRFGASDAVQSLMPIRARMDRIFDITVGLRPFRPAGPRVEAERLGDTLVVHNYGHGGSGWSLSWGSSARAVRLAMEAGPRDVAVIGCGALGLTSAILAQRAGARVTIHAREQLPQTTSARATGEWTPDSRIALADVAAPGFGTQWEEMARTAFRMHRDYLGLPGTPVEWVDQYAVTDESPPGDRPSKEESPSRAAHKGPDFAVYRRRIADLTPGWRLVPAEDSPFGAASVSKSEIMVFNIAGYGHTLLDDFFTAGGKFRRADFAAPSQVAALPEKVVINCTGYGARALWKDETLVPVRGQIARLIPQPEVRYGLIYRHVLTVPRRDGIVVQSFEGGETQGYGDTSETVDRAETERAVATLATLFSPARWRGV